MFKLFSFTKNELFSGMQLFLFKIKWKKKNKHNHTLPGRFFDDNKVTVGKGTYGELNVYTFNNADERLTIGDYCSIAPNVQFVLGGEHETNVLMTYPCDKYLFQGENIAGTKGEIVIGDDVWIGQGTIILSGVRIGQGAVVGAGSVVYKDISPYAVYAGYKIVKYRFSDEIIEKLLSIKLGEIDYHSMNTRNALKKVVEINNVDSILEEIMN